MKKRYALIPLAAIALPALALFGLGARSSAPAYAGPASDHFDGRVFRNQLATAEHGLREVLRWQRERDVGRWDGFEAETLAPEIVTRVAGDELRVTFIGHASTLIQTAGLNVLTDPVWSRRASPVTFAGPERHAAPGIAFADLPPIDVVLVSHNHYDHLDVDTLALLAAGHAPAIYLPLGNTALLEERGIDGGRDLDWWDSAALANEVTLTAVPAQHFSGRGFFDDDRTLWAGFVLETPGGVIYFAGDTGVGPHFEQVRERFGPPRLALLPIGAYLPAWFMRPVHVSPREAAEAHLTLGARTSLGVHFGCFELADDGPGDPPRELAEARAALGIADEAFRAPVVGGVYDVRR